MQRFSLHACQTPALRCATDTARQVVEGFLVFRHDQIILGTLSSKIRNGSHLFDVRFCAENLVHGYGRLPVELELIGYWTRRNRMMICRSSRCAGSLPGMQYEISLTDILVVHNSFFCGVSLISQFTMGHGSELGVVGGWISSICNAIVRLSELLPKR